MQRLERHAAGHQGEARARQTGQHVRRLCQEIDDGRELGLGRGLAHPMPQKLARRLQVAQRLDAAQRLEQCRGIVLMGAMPPASRSGSHVAAR